MIQCFASTSGGGDSYVQVFLDSVLPDKLAETAGAEAGIKRSILNIRFARNNTSYFTSPLVFVFLYGQLCALRVFSVQGAWGFFASFTSDRLYGFLAFFSDN